jgi:hypothetical protein
MINRMHPWTQLAISCFLLVSLICCSKPKPTEDPGDTQPPASDYEALLTTPSVTYCGDSFTSDLVMKDGTVIGDVIVGNDTKDLYLTYNLKDNWYMTSVESYAGKKSLIPLTASGSPDQSHFPGRMSLNACDQHQKVCFKILLSSLKTDENGQCYTNEQFFIAMRATAKSINSGADCKSGSEVEAWAAPVLINPGNADEWATAFYFCKQDCTPWCAFGQGYWFNKPGVEWCRPDVTFGTLAVLKDSAGALWPAANNEVRKAFFQAASLQLSMFCNNNGRPIPAAIATDYQLVADFLSHLSYAEIKNGTYPAGTDINAIKNAAGNIGRWICANNCNSHEDPTLCQ